MVRPFAVCAPVRAFFIISAKKQFLTPAPKVRCIHAAIAQIRRADRRQDTDYLHGAAALWACELSRRFRFFDQIVARNVAEQKFELLQNLFLSAAHPAVVAHLL